MIHLGFFLIGNSWMADNFIALAPFLFLLHLFGVSNFFENDASII